MNVSLRLLVLACFAPVVSAKAQECSAEATRPDTRIVHGVVRNASGLPVDGARIIASWVELATQVSAAGRARTAEARTDDTGAYRFCGLPRNSAISIQAVAARTSLGTVTVSPGATSDVSRADIPERHAGELVTVRGVVRDTSGAALEGARLEVDGAAAALSDAGGNFELTVARTGDVEVAVRLMGFKPRHMRLSATAGAETMEVVLEPVAVVLKSVSVAALPAAFESVSGFGERRRRGTGAFFDRADLDRMRPQSLTDVLRSVGGIQVHTTMTRWGYQTTPSSTRATGGAIGCSIDYYVNGHQYTPTSMGIDRDMAPDQIEAIEVYKSSEVPPQFLGPKSRCGVVVIWTRYRAHELDG